MRLLRFRFVPSLFFQFCVLDSMCKLSTIKNNLLDKREMTTTQNEFKEIFHFNMIWFSVQQVMNKFNICFIFQMSRHLVGIFINKIFTKDIHNAQMYVHMCAHYYSQNGELRAFSLYSLICSVYILNECKTANCKLHTPKNNQTHAHPIHSSMAYLQKEYNALQGTRREYIHFYSQLFHVMPLMVISSSNVLSTVDSTYTQFDIRYFTLNNIKENLLAMQKEKEKENGN